MRQLALVLAATLACAAPAFADPAPQDPMDELSGDPDSPQRHLIPPGAHEPLIEESDGTIMIGFTTGMKKAEIASFLETELKKDGWRITSNMDVGTGVLYLLTGTKHGDGLIALTRENGRIRILVSLTP